MSLHARSLRSELDSLARCRDHGGVVAEPLAEPLESAGAGFHRLDTARRAELRDGDARELCRRVGEDPEPDARRRKSPEGCADLRCGPEVDRRALLRVTLEQDAPVAGRAPVELGSGLRAIGGKPRLGRSRAPAARR